MLTMKIVTNDASQLVFSLSPVALGVESTKSSKVVSTPLTARDLCIMLRADVTANKRNTAKIYIEREHETDRSRATVAREIAELFDIPLSKIDVELN